MEKILVDATFVLLLTLVINSSLAETKSQAIAARVSCTDQNYVETARLHGKIFWQRIHN